MEISQMRRRLLRHSGLLAGLLLVFCALAAVSLRHYHASPESARVVRNSLVSSPWHESTSKDQAKANTSVSAVTEGVDVAGQVGSVARTTLQSANPQR